MDYKIKKLDRGRVEIVHEILEKCGHDLKKRHGLSHWVPAYSMHLLRRDAEEKSVYAVSDGGRTAATFTIGTEPADYYDMSLWESPDARAIYVSRLAVLPEEQGSGIGTWCMGAVERIAAEAGCGAVRLDAYEKHAKLLEFYDKLGYRRRGIVRCRETELVCFEKV